MRTPFALAILFLIPSASLAQNDKVQDAVGQKLATIRFVQNLQDPHTGAFRTAADAKGPGLRATSAAVRSLKYLTGKPAKEAVPHADKTAAFVLACFDPKTGGFADIPGGKPDVFLTSVGVMAAVELDIPREKYRKAMDYLKENAKTFEDVRIGAAAVEAWGVKDCPFDLKPWFRIADNHFKDPTVNRPTIQGRDLGSLTAFHLRLGHKEFGHDLAMVLTKLDGDQTLAGGWENRNTASSASDLESTYRVMRAYYLLGERPRRHAALREFVGKCRNTDGGYGVKPGESSSAGGVYYATIVTKWLDEMGKK